MKTPSRSLAIALCVGITFMLPAHVSAAVVTIVASGDVDTVSQPALNPLLGKELVVTAMYTTLATDSNPSANTAVYLDGLISFVATLDGQPLTGASPFPGNNIEVDNDLGDPFFDNFAAVESHQGLAVSFPGDGLGPYDRANTALVLRDLDSLAFSNTSLPTSFNLADFDIKFLSTNLRPETNDFNTRVDATITSFSFSVDPIPEPAALVLGGWVLLVPTFFSRRRK
jgi:hypothetical protein